MRVARRLVLAIAMIAGSLAPVFPAFAQPEEGRLLSREAVEKDLKATIRFLELKLDRERQFLLRDGEAEALKVERECLRHEIKCLERIGWYVRREPGQAAKRRAIAAALAKLREKTPEASLQERKQAGFRVHELVSNPFGETPEAGAEPAAEVKRTTFVATRAVVNKPKPSTSPTPPSRLEGVKAPEVIRPDAGSAGSAGSRSDRP